jgi:ubiquinone/menaquinone biosynthesis C-methylase UbiE
MGVFKHVWGQGVIDLERRDLAALKLKRCMDSLKASAGSALEIGCGAGMFIRSFKAHAPAFDCHAGDIDEASIKLAKTFNDGVSYTVFNAESLPYEDGKFDVVMLFDIVEHVENIGKLLDEIMRVSRKGATIHIYVPCEKEPLTIHWLLWKLRIGHNLKKKHAGHIQRLTKKCFVDMVREKGFEIMGVEYSTYLIGQLIDIAYYACQEIVPLKKKLMNAHASKNISEGGDPILTSALKGVINVAFLISYLESVIIRRAALAQGVHLSCRKP